MNLKYPMTSQFLLNFIIKFLYKFLYFLLIVLLILSDILNEFIFLQFSIFALLFLCYYMHSFSESFLGIHFLFSALNYSILFCYKFRPFISNNLFIINQFYNFQEFLFLIFMLCQCHHYMHPLNL